MFGWNVNLDGNSLSVPICVKECMGGRGFGVFELGPGVAIPTCHIRCAKIESNDIYPKLMLEKRRALIMYTYINDTSVDLTGERRRESEGKIMIK